jgi:COX Aromatic Rich Motif
VSSVKDSSLALDMDEYKKLASPSKNNPASFYLLKDEMLFDKIIMKFMHPQEE